MSQRRPASDAGTSPERAAETLARSFGFEPVDPADKAARVRGVFERVAGRYDLMNDLMSAGVHRLWKEALIDWLAPRPGCRHLDVAGGTGDIALRLLDRVAGRAEVALVDINPAMITIGRDRALERGWLAEVLWIAGDAERLPLRDHSFDAYTIAFGIRNVTHLDRALAEAYRVLRPGGRFVCLEFSAVDVPGLDVLYDVYSFNVIPALGRMVVGDAEPYRYLVESIRRFPRPQVFADMISAAGFRRVSVRPMTGGIVALHAGWRL